MSRSNQDYLQKIHTASRDLLTKMEILNPKADDVFLNKKMAILREIPRFSSVDDIDCFLKSPLNSTSDETNAAFLKESNAQFFTQSHVFFAKLRSQMMTVTPNLYQKPIFWLGLFCLWYFSAVLNTIIYGALILFGIWSFASIVDLCDKESKNHATCVDTMLLIESHIVSAKLNVPQASGMIQRPSGAEQLLSAILHADYDAEAAVDALQDTPLHILLTARMASHSTENIVRMKSAIEKLQHLKYHRNQQFATPLLALCQSDPYQLRPLFKLDHMLNIGSTFAKMDAFFNVFKAKPKETQRFLLLEGPAGTGKSATVVQYLGEQKNCVIQEWVVGSQSDQWRSQLEARITTTFQTIIASAKTDPSRTYILYLDKIESICPHVVNSGGQPSSRTSSYTGVAEQFQRNIENLRKNTTNVMVVATTTSALSLSRSMRTLGTRILFALPTYPERVTLLTHFLVEKQISSEKIRHIARLTDGWPPQALVSLVNEIVEIKVDDAAINRAYDRAAAIMENDFKQAHSFAELHLPRWTNETDASEYQVLTPRCIENCFTQLQDYLHHQEYYTRTPMHVLLSGPPGGGKTTAVRNFSLQSKVVFILVKSGILSFELSRLLESANRFDRALVFIDEVDQCSCLDILQTQMDGFKGNNTIIIGATNHPNIIQARAALWSRFKFKVEVPALDNEQRGQYISWIIRRELEMAPRVSVDTTLQQDLAQNCPILTTASAEKDMRRIGWDLQTFFGQRRSALAKGGVAQEITLAATSMVFGTS